MKPYALGHIAWRSTPPPLTRDIDGIADDRILAILSASTLTPIEQCRATTLASYEGVLFESHQPLGRTAWIMPLGVRARTRLSPGLQYCPACMEQAPYYRRLWRVSWATACIKHKLRLLDRCSHCTSILAPFRARGFACFNCGAALADGQRLPASEMVLSFQIRQEAILAQGWGELGTIQFPYSIQYFQTIRHVARSLSLGARATTFRTMAAESWGGDPSPYQGEKRDIDVLTATERHRLFDLVSRLLVDCRNGSSRRPRRLGYGNHGPYAMMTGRPSPMPPWSPTAWPRPDILHRVQKFRARLITCADGPPATPSLRSKTLSATASIFSRSSTPSAKRPSCRRSARHPPAQFAKLDELGQARKSAQVAWRRHRRHRRWASINAKDAAFRSQSCPLQRVVRQLAPVVGAARFAGRPYPLALAFMPYRCLYDQPRSSRT